MVAEQLVARDIHDHLVLSAFAKVKRELFVDDEWKTYAYKDHPLSIGSEQTISQPYIVAFMMQLLELSQTDKVLEIGTGSGYQTALLAEVVAEVYTIERIEGLLKKAMLILKDLDYKNIFYKIGDGSLGWVNTVPPVAEFDNIIVSAASQYVPDSLFSQLKIGGRLIAPVGPKGIQDLIIYEKKEATITSKKVCEVMFVPLIS